jgi:hypothetical protein
LSVNHGASPSERNKEGEQSLLEKQDKIRVNQSRTAFYQLNEKFEQLLQFKPIRKVHLWRTEMDMQATYNIFKAFKIEEIVESMEEKIK